MAVYIDLEACENGIKHMYDEAIGYVQSLDAGRIFLNRLKDHTSNSIETVSFIQSCDEILRQNQRFIAIIEDYAKYLKGQEIILKNEDGPGTRKEVIE